MKKLLTILLFITSYSYGQDKEIELRIKLLEQQSYQVQLYTENFVQTHNAGLAAIGIGLVAAGINAAFHKPDEAIYVVAGLMCLTGTVTIAYAPNVLRKGYRKTKIINIFAPKYRQDLF